MGREGQAATPVPPVHSMILDVPFRNASSAVYHHLLGFPLLPFGSACSETLCSYLLRDGWPSDKTIGSLQCPLLTISAGRDDKVSSRAGRELLDIAKSSNSRRICMHLLLPKARHNNTFKHDKWIESVKTFVSDNILSMEVAASMAEQD